MPIYKFNYRISDIDSCSLNFEDFRTLYRLLNEKVKEAIKSELDEAPKRFSKITTSQIGELQQNIKQYLKLSIQGIGAKGELLSGDDISIFDETSFPEKLKQLVFDNSIPYKNITGQEPLNKVVIQFDFSKAKIFDFSYPSKKTDPQKSTVYIHGANDTWVRGVYDTILSFIKDRKRIRKWLHSELTYNLYLYIIFYPITFWCIYKVSEYLKGNMSIVLSIGIYFYILFIILFLLRCLLNYAKWIFPLCEYVPKSGTKMGKHRTFLYLIIIGIVPTFLISVIKAITKFFK